MPIRAKQPAETRPRQQSPQPRRPVFPAVVPARDRNAAATFRLPSSTRTRPTYPFLPTAMKIVPAAKENGGLLNPAARADARSRHDFRTAVALALPTRASRARRPVTPRARRPRSSVPGARASRDEPRLGSHRRWPRSRAGIAPPDRWRHPPARHRDTIGKSPPRRAR